MASLSFIRDVRLSARVIPSGCGRGFGVLIFSQGDEDVLGRGWYAYLFLWRYFVTLHIPHGLVQNPRWSRVVYSKRWRVQNG
jgi:hypothetical protein